MLKRWLRTLFAALMATFAFVTPHAFAAAPAQPVLAKIHATPALWTVRGPKGTAYLFGSIHILPPNMEWHTPKIAAALKASDTFVFEIPMDDSTKTRIADFVRDNAFLPKDQSLPSLLNDEARKDYRNALTLATRQAVHTVKQLFGQIKFGQSLLGQARITGVKQTAQTVPQTHVRHTPSQHRRNHTLARWQWGHLRGQKQGLPQALELSLGHLPGVLSAQLHRARLGLERTGQQMQQRGFASTGRADDSHLLTGCNIQRHPMQSQGALVAGRRVTASALLHHHIHFSRPAARAAFSMPA